MGKASSRRRIVVLLTSTVLTATITAGALNGAAFAQTAEQTYQFNVPAKPIRQAMNDIVRVTGIDVVFPETGAASAMGRPVRGTMTPQQAVAALLSGTGLSHKFTSAKTVAISDPTMGSALQSAPSADGTTVLNTITVSGGQGALGSYDDTYKSAGSVAYISSEEIEQKRGSSVGDFIGGIPGVLNGDSRNSGALDVNIRGMQGQGRVPVIIDGASQEQTVYRGYNGARSGSYVDPDMIGEVAIEKGASSGADATGAIGGIVRMQTISADDILLPGKQFGVRLRGGFNSNSASVPAVFTQGGMLGGRFPEGTTPVVRDGGNMDRPGLLDPTGGNGSIAGAFTSENVDLVAAYARRKNGNYFSGEHGKGQPHFVDLGTDYGYQTIGYEGLSPWKAGEEILNTSTDNKSLLFKGNFRFGDDHAIELSYMDFDSTYGEIMPTRLGTHTSAVGGYQSELDKLDLKTWTARYRWDPESDLINLKVDLFRTDMDHRATNLLTVSGITTESYSWSQTVRDGVTVSNESKIDVVPGDFKLEYGGAWQHEKVGLPDGYENDKWTINHIEFPPRTGSRTQKSAFLNSNWEINSQWQLKTGLRYSDYKTTDHNYTLNALTFWPNATYELVPGQHTDRSGHGWSKNISLSWTPTDSIQLYGRYSDAIRLPTIFESIKGFSTGLMPDELLPERAKTFEIGANKSFENVISENDLLRTHIAYYDNDIDNYLTRSNVPYNIPGGTSVIGSLGMVNLENARMSGIEVSADYERGPLSARLSWNHAIRSRFCAKPGTLHRIDDLCTEGGFANSYALQHVPPKDTVSMQMTYKMFEERLTLGTRVSYYSNRFVKTKVASTSEIQPGNWNPYTLVDVFGSYKFNESKQIDFAIDNLTDRYYMDAINAALMPGPGRTFRLNMTAKF